MNHPSIRRPAAVTWLVIGVLIIAVSNGLRLTNAVEAWAFLSGLPGVSPTYQAVTGLIWLVAGLWTALDLCRGRPHAPKLALGFIILYLIYAWIDLLLIAGERPTTLGGANIPFRAGLSVFVLVYTLGALNFSRSKAYFRRNHER